jgi:hypothetical protein
MKTTPDPDLHCSFSLNADRAPPLKPSVGYLPPAYLTLEQDERQACKGIARSTEPLSDGAMIMKTHRNLSLALYGDAFFVAHQC